jgi:glucose/arabinose dehydrogenase
VLFAPESRAQNEVRLDDIELPDGFQIEVFANQVAGARSMALSEGGVLYVGTRDRSGNVYAVVDSNRDAVADRVHTIAKGLFMPNGIAWRDGSLYVAEVNRVLRFDGIDARLEDPPEPVVVRDGLPSERHHGWKYLAFGPDGKLYLQIGAPCNVCERGDPYATIQRMDPDGSNLEIVARGVRNTVGFDWHPETGVLWFTDNGRDMMGDNVPPDELNRAPELGLHFGFPYCHGGYVPDPEHGKERPCSDFVPPARKLDPHVAAIGMLFYTGDQFPERYRGEILIAEHGSWNRTDPIGYRIMMVTVDEQGQATSYEPFATGWLQAGGSWGRPVDLLLRPDGSLLVSDDQRGVIYRIHYRGE